MNTTTPNPEIAGSPAKPEFIPDTPVQPQIPFEPEIIPEPAVKPSEQPQELPPIREAGWASLIILLMLVMTLFSGCTKDHQIPVSEIEIRTLPFSLATQSTVFRMEAVQLGDQPVVEHGVVYTAYFRGVGNHNQLPTVSDNKVAFDTKLSLGANEYTYAKDIIAGRTFFYYRAYAILDDHSVVYANKLSYVIE
ncbi:hypothetical protein [Dyadobacter sp. OTU695]|uniref:hypothetical protein n=1 Tax=Dyadobacter sp. OTU695 TaxID=3043860 RepID=UPI00313CF006